MAKSRLGRGLSAILEDVEEAYKSDIEADKSSVKKIKLSKIIPNKYQPRKHFDEDALNSLSESIKKHGLLQPIVVIQKDDNYMIIAGERRFRASKLAGLEEIDAIVADLENQNLRELALIENIQREELSAIELAISYKELINDYKITQEELSSIICKSRSHIANTMRLLTLSPYTQDLIKEGKISQGHAKVLVGLDKEDEKKIVDTIIGQKLSVRESEELVRKLKNKKQDSKKSDKKDLKTDIKPKLLNVKKALENLGIKSNIKDDKLTLKFDDEEKIDNFLELLNKIL